jgi:hypothetical protein
MWTTSDKLCGTVSVLALLSTGYLVRAAQDTHATVEERFIPPDLGVATMIACGVGGQADGTVKVFVQVSYGERRGDYRPMIALRKDALTGLRDCNKWNDSLAEALAEVSRRRSIPQ